MVQRSDARPPIVGLSANVLDTQFTNGQLDGIGTYTLALERALVNLGVRTVRVGMPRRRRFNFIHPRNIDIAFRFPLSFSMAATTATGIATPFTSRIERAIDVYHATDYFVPRLRRTPVVATLYDAIPLAHPEWGNQRLRLVKNRILRAGAADADVVLAISHAAVDEIVLHYRVPRARVRVVPLGVDEEWFTRPSSSQIDAFCRARGVRKDCFFCVGTLQPRKNIGALIVAYDRLPADVRATHQLVIAGRYGWGAEELKADLEARRRKGDVVWLDYVSQDELRALFAIARSLVFPTLAEGFGLPVLEAFACGTPVIASDLAALREVAGSHAVFVPPGDIDRLAEAMKRMADTPPDHAALALARRRARQFPWADT